MVVRRVIFDPDRGREESYEPAGVWGLNKTDNPLNETTPRHLQGGCSGRGSLGKLQNRLMLPGCRSE
jgi:hypothetical protein